MKTTALLTILAAFILHPSAFVFAQGPLTPPGAPAPTMKTLDQIQPRTPISSVPFTISTAGSYYLTGNVSVTTGSAITIAADNVALDLNGFTISSTASPASGSGVAISGTLRNVSVKNGHIAGTTTYSGGVFTTGGFTNGILSGSSTSANLRFSDLDVLGVGSSGIDASASSPSARNVIERCSVSVCGGVGLRAGSVLDSHVDTAGTFGTVAELASRCFSESVGSSGSNQAISSRMVDSCEGVANAGNGIFVSSSGAVQNSVGISTSGNGMSIFGVVSNSRGTSTSGIGISATNAMNCIGSSTSGTFGLSVSGTANSCQGQRDGGVAISAGIAIGCTVTGTGTVTSTNKFLGTP